MPFTGSLDMKVSKEPIVLNHILTCLFGLGEIKIDGNVQFEKVPITYFGEKPYGK